MLLSMYGLYLLWIVQGVCWEYSTFVWIRLKNLPIVYSRDELWTLKPPSHKDAKHVLVSDHVKHQIME